MTICEKWHSVPLPGVKKELGGGGGKRSSVPESWEVAFHSQIAVITVMLSQSDRANGMTAARLFDFQEPFSAL